MPKTHKTPKTPKTDQEVTDTTADVVRTPAEIAALATFPAAHDAPTHARNADPGDKELAKNGMRGKTAVRIFGRADEPATDAKGDE